MELKTLKLEIGSMATTGRKSRGKWGEKYNEIGANILYSRVTMDNHNSINYKMRV